MQAVLVGPPDHRAMHPAAFALIDDIQPIPLENSCYWQHGPSLDRFYLKAKETGSIPKWRVVRADQYVAQTFMVESVRCWRDQ